MTFQYRLRSFLDCNIFYAPAVAEGALSFTLVRLYVRPYVNWFPFFNLSLPQLNVMKLIQDAYYHKTLIMYEFG